MSEAHAWRLCHHRMRALPTPPLLLLLLLACAPQISAHVLCVSTQRSTCPRSGGAEAVRRTPAAALRHRIAPRRAGQPVSLLSGLSVPDDKQPTFAVGQRVRVAIKTQLMHVPGRKEGFNAEGRVGSVLRVYDEANLSANRKIKVELVEPETLKKYIAHFEPRELAHAADDE